MAQNLAEKLQVEQERRFVGRVEELSRFRAMLNGGQAVLYVHGPGGVGKSALLGHFERLATATSHATYRLECRDIPCSREDFRRALITVFGGEVGGTADLDSALQNVSGPSVLLIDTFEGLAGIEDWVREFVLPLFPETLKTVIVSRRRPSHRWRMDPFWRNFGGAISLRNFSVEETADFFSRMNMPQNYTQRAIQLTYGHPLAVSLLAETYALTGDLTDELAGGSDLIEALLERFLGGVQDTIHRDVLEVAALARVTTESLLAEVFDPHLAGDLFRWLAELSFIESTVAGLVPHDLARDVIAAELAWRHPDQYAATHTRLRAYYATHLERSHGLAQQAILFDYIYLHRSNPVIRPFYEWHPDAAPTLDTVREGDAEKILEAVQKYEGSVAAAALAHDLSKHPDRFTIFRIGGGEAQGFMSQIGIPEDPSLEESLDPGLNQVARALAARRPLREGEAGILFRHWMAFDGYQDVSPSQSQAFVNVVRVALTTPGLSVTGLVCATPNPYEPMLDYGSMRKLEGADFQVSGRNFSTYILDWRLLSPQAWLTQLGEKEVPFSGEPAAKVGSFGEGIVLSKSLFEKALISALKSYTNDEQLATNPLCKARFVLDSVPEGDSPLGSLRQNIVSSLEALKANPKDRKLYAALVTSYIKPMPSQEQAAERLDVSIASYRRHLKAGVERITKSLWLKEIGQ